MNPTCKTCKHWNRIWIQNGKAECLAVNYVYDGKPDGNPACKETPESSRMSLDIRFDFEDSSPTVNFTTGENFGCNMHAPTAE